MKDKEVSIMQMPKDAYAKVLSAFIHPSETRGASKPCHHYGKEPNNLILLKTI